MAMKRGIGFGLLVWTLAVGCAPPLDPGYRIQSLRVVAVVAEPPEAVSGEAIELRALIASPEGPVNDDADYRWWHCVSENDDPLSDPLICRTENEQKTLAQGDRLTDSIPTDLFGAGAGVSQDGYDTLLRSIFGYWRVLGLTVSQTEQSAEAVKRVPIYPAASLADLDPKLAELDVRHETDGQLHSNRNPELLGLEVLEGGPDGEPVASLVAGQSYWLRPVYNDESLQAYSTIESDLQGLGHGDPASLAGLSQDEILARLRKVRRCEVPIFSWYVTEGTLQQETTADERVLTGIHAFRGEECPPLQGPARRPEVQFTAPADVTSEGPVHVWAVMRDGRGGTAALHLALTVASP